MFLKENPSLFLYKLQHLISEVFDLRKFIQGQYSGKLSWSSPFSVGIQYGPRFMSQLPANGLWRKTQGLGPLHAHGRS